jgi:hypothetical protein
MVLKVLVYIATESNELPSGLFIRGVHIDSQCPAGCGAFADVFRGTLDGQPIAIKRLRINENGKARDNIHRVSRVSHQVRKFE